TRSSIFNGLSAQMLRYRKFVGKPSVMEGVATEWYVIGKHTFCSFTDAYTRHDSEHYHMRRRNEKNAQGILCCVPGELGGIGQHGLYISNGEKYDFAIVAKCVEDVLITVSLTDRSGNIVYDKKEINIKSGEEYTRYTAKLIPFADDYDADIRISFDRNVCVCVGCVSLMNEKNFRGMRLDVIEGMKELGISVLRWPGGNFAGEYCWFDGLLDVDERAPFASYLHLETQGHTLGYDFHEINTDDFIELCRLIGAEPFITINLAWNSPEENAAWVEYCNGDVNTKYGKIRALRGHPEPYNVSLWSLGNEMGYGHMEGDNSILGYTRLARENAQKMLEVCPELELCCSGVYPDKEWIEQSAKPLSGIAKYVSLHHYTYQPNYVNLTQLRKEYEGCIADVANARKKVREMHSSLGDRLQISFDEWNLWYGWFRPSTVVDGIYTGMFMTMLISESLENGIGMACQFEAVNESAIKVMPDKVELSATGQAIALFKNHIDGRLKYADDYVIATEKNGYITVTVVNPLFDEKKTYFFNCEYVPTETILYEGISLLPHSHFELSDLEIVCENGWRKLEVPAHSMVKIKFKKQ
ncbi:MAG: hypothetical protein IJ391_04135, partial [Clostridia bacterium]|nr:hypothetical protein [Clostridia bacterium]